jgi:hypothetical protein
MHPDFSMFFVILFSVEKPKKTSESKSFCFGIQNFLRPFMSFQANINAMDCCLKNNSQQRRKMRSRLITLHGLWTRGTAYKRHQVQCTIKNGSLEICSRICPPCALYPQSSAKLLLSKNYLNISDQI